jgi:structure-specific recognition protein 1
VNNHFNYIDKIFIILFKHQLVESERFSFGFLYNMTIEESKAKIFDNVTLNGQSLGVLKVHPGGISWKGKDTGRILTYPARDIQKWQWLRTASGPQLRVQIKGKALEEAEIDGENKPFNQTLWKFNEFREQDIESLSEFVKQHFQMDINEIPTSVKGWNWGEVDFNTSADDLTLKLDGKQVFELPISEVTNCGLSGKNEVNVEFRVDDSKDIKDDSLVEIRFYVPGTMESGEFEKQSLAEVSSRKILKAESI